MNFTLSNELDYSLLSLEDRKNMVEDLIDKYDQELVHHYDNFHKVNLSQSDKTSEFDHLSKDLERVADYLLYADNKEQREKQKKEKLLNKRQTYKRKKKEVLTDDFTSMEDNKKTGKNNRVYGKIKIYEQDRKDHKELAETGQLIKMLKYQIKNKKDSKGNELSNDQLKKLKWYLIDKGKEEIALKEQLKRYIVFKNITHSPPFQDLKNFSFENKKHVKVLFDNYQQLKENTEDYTDNDFKILLFVFEDLVEKNIREPILKKIFDLKIQGETQDQIKKKIFKEFKLDISRRRIAQILDEIIPSLIVDQYKKDFEDWVFTFVFKGKYKFCPSCKENKLANLKYFHKDIKQTDKLKTICKICRRKK